jgi:hypothetical protein
MTRFSRARRHFLFISGLVAIVASRPALATAQIIATPAAGAASGPRLPIQRVPQHTQLPGERSELLSRAATSGTTIHLSTLAIIIGVVILVILLV